MSKKVLFVKTEAPAVRNVYRKRCHTFLSTSGATGEPSVKQTVK